MELNKVKGNHLINEFIDTYSSDEIINFCGLIEADKVLNADCDVIVCDGFTGNIAIKSIQGSVNYMNKKLLKFGFKIILSQILIVRAHLLVS